MFEPELLKSEFCEICLPNDMNHTVQPDSFSTVGAFSTVDPVVGRIYVHVQCKY